jgi:hypothetical protein
VHGPVDDYAKILASFKVQRVLGIVAVSVVVAHIAHLDGLEESHGGLVVATRTCHRHAKAHEHRFPARGRPFLFFDIMVLGFHLISGGRGRKTLLRASHHRPFGGSWFLPTHIPLTRGDARSDPFGLRARPGTETAVPATRHGGSSVKWL